MLGPAPSPCAAKRVVDRPSGVHAAFGRVLEPRATDVTRRILLGGVASALALPRPPARASSGLSTFSSESRGFSLSYPDTWVVGYDRTLLSQKGSLILVGDFGGDLTTASVTLTPLDRDRAEALGGMGERRPGLPLRPLTTPPQPHSCPFRFRGWGGGSRGGRRGADGGAAVPAQHRGLPAAQLGASRAGRALLLHVRALGRLLPGLDRGRGRGCHPLHRPGGHQPRGKNAPWQVPTPST